VAVWVGYPDRLVPMTTDFGGKPVFGGTYPALIWHDFMLAALQVEHDRSAHKSSSTGAKAGSGSQLESPASTESTEPHAPARSNHSNSTGETREVTPATHGTGGGGSSGGGEAPPKEPSPATPAPATPTPAGSHTAFSSAWMP
jgi:penicillin-binding protein 1A